MAKTELDFVPFADYVLLEPIAKNETAGGIALPDGANTGPEKGCVVAVGPGRHTDNGVLIPPSVEVGTLVYIWCAYQEPIGVELCGKKYVLTRERDLIGKVKA